MARTWAARLGYVFANSAFRLLKEKMDPRKVNGGVFLGLNGVVIKSHGGTDEEGFASAIDLAREMARNDLVRMIAEDRALGAGAAEPQPIAAASA
jgi:glycerol-3-phosphate acyltransferase PlsX